MLYFERLRKKSRKILQILQKRYNADDALFLADDVVNLTEQKSVAPPPEEVSFFDSLRATYIDVAESDPEAALRMIQEELSANPPKPIFDALIEIERYIRQTYCGQYFRGVRIKSSD